MNARRFLTSSLAAALLATPAFAKGDDVDFARALVRDGFIDLATEYCDRLGKDSGTSAEDKAGLQLIQAEIFAKNATLQEDAAKTQEELDKAVKVLEDFIRNNSGHPRAPEAKFQIGVLLRQKGDFNVAQMKKETDSAKKADLVAEGEKNFKRAEEYFAALKDEYRKMKDDWFQRTNGRTPTPAEAKEEEDITYNLMDAFYNEPRTLYSHCMLYEAGSKEKKELAAKAVALFMDFELDYQDRMKAYESSIFWALTHKELSEFDKVYPRFDFTISLAEFFQGQALPDDAREIVLTAYYYKAMTYNEERKWQDAIKTIEEMLVKFKEAKKDRIGIAAALVMGDAYVGLGEKEKAVDMATKLMAEAPTEGLKAMIRKRIVDWASSGGGNVSLYMMRYEQAMDEEKFYAAIAALQGAIAAAESAEQRDIMPDLLWKLGKVYDMELGRLYDAVIVYETIATDHQASKLAPQAAFKAAQTWNSIAAKIGAEKSWEKDQVTKNLQLLTNKWPNDPNAKAAQYLVADALYERGSYEEAAKEFAKVKPEAVLYEQAMVMEARAYYEYARKLWADGKKDDKTMKMFDGAEAAFKKYIDYAAKNQPTEQMATVRPQVEAFCKQGLANLLMHEARKKYDDALKVLDQIESKDEKADGNKKVWRQKVTAFLATGKTNEAIAVTEKLLSNFKAAAVTVEACQLVGAKCDEDAEKLVGADPAPDKITDEALRLWELAAKYYSNWIRSSIEAKMKIDPVEALQVADRIYSLGLAINKIDDKKSFTGMDLNALRNPKIFRDAAKIYEPIANEELGRLKGIDSGKLFLKLAWCLDFSQEWEQARDAYERLIETERLRNPGGKTLNDAVLKNKAWLFVAYEELGHVYMRLAEMGLNKNGSLSEAYVIFANVVDKSEKMSEAWWRAKYLVIKILFERGAQGDFNNAMIGITDMRQNYPKWDEGKFGMQAMWDELEKQIKDKAPRK